LIGDAGTVGGDELGWTDIATDDTGRLFALSVFQTESEGEPYLYELNPSTGSVIATIGAPGDSRYSDFDHDGDTFYGSGAVDVFLCCGQLFSMDTTAQPTWISSDTLGYGLNPYDTTGTADPIARGGFAIHPMTGDFWGIEALQSQATVLYRIDPVTGLADSIMKVGPPEFGYDGLHILDDGTFIATRGGVFTSEDSVVWEIGSVPDSVSGLAEIAPISLTFDTLVVGGLNGLTRLTSSPDSTLTLSLTADTTELHPWVRSDTIIIGDTLRQAERDPDATAITLAATVGGSSLSGQVVNLTAEFLPGTGGHVHLDNRLDFTDAPLVQAQAAAGRPVTGYFKQGTNRTASLIDTTDANGEISFTFVAGFLGGDIELIAAATYGGSLAADTLAIRLRVPGLFDLQDNGTANANAAFVGGTPYPPSSPPDTVHPQDSIWYVTPTFRDSVVLVIEAMAMPSSSRYLQANDASLPFGGAFSVFPVTTSIGDLIDRPFNGTGPMSGHGTHAKGIDLDIAYCYATDPGMDPDQDNRVTGTGCSGPSRVNGRFLTEAAHSRGLIVLREGDHYHLRLPEGT
jgi:hypothetical protein